MRLTIIILHFMIIGGIIVLTSACSLIQPLSSLSPAAKSSRLSSNQFSREIIRLEGIIRTNSDLASKKRAHLELAELYISFKNPERNYKIALIHLENYAALEPMFDEQYKVRNWLAALKEIERLSMAIPRQENQKKMLSYQIKNSGRKDSVPDKKKSKLDRQNGDLEKINAELRKKNQKLEETIEKLKNLDRRLEEKRKSFNQ